MAATRVRQCSAALALALDEARRAAAVGGLVTS